MNKLLLSAISSSLLLAACGSPEPTGNDAEQNANEERAGGSFIEREKRRARENDENRRRASEDLFGPSPESADSDRGEGVP
tara:strand:+ start:6988 stop:7230 length:243 start_codon:yes stop_codon:yes gene_type:complete